MLFSTRQLVPPPTGQRCPRKAPCTVFSLPITLPSNRDPTRSSGVREDPGRRRLAGRRVSRSERGLARSGAARGEKLTHRRPTTLRGPPATDTVTSTRPHRGVDYGRVEPRGSLPHSTLGMNPPLCLVRMRSPASGRGEPPPEVDSAAEGAGRCLRVSAESGGRGDRKTRAVGVQGRLAAAGPGADSSCR